MNPNKPQTVLDSLNRALHTALMDDPKVLMLGQDILDPYGGSFKVSRGLSSEFPDRVLTTPVSEAGITGIAGGMALRGLRPVVEIMFGDFTTLISDQVVNYLAKYNLMYDENVPCPVVIRTPMGGRRGYGPTHSQTLEKHFIGVPGLTVLAPFHLMSDHPLGAPGELLYSAITGIDSPVLFVENKLQYLLKLFTPEDQVDFSIEKIQSNGQVYQPCYHVTLQSSPPPQVTLAAYGYMAHLAMQAAQQLAYEDEIFCEIFIATCLTTLAPLWPLAGRTGRLLAVEEGTRTLGWGAEVLAGAAEALGAGLKKAGRAAARDTVVPAAKDLEEACLPGVMDIINHVREMVR